jgi:hypothetical protein
VKRVCICYDAEKVSDKLFEKYQRNFAYFFSHKGTSLHNIYMVHFMPIVAILGQCLFDLFYACSVTDINLKTIFFFCAVSVILARPNYLQQCFSVSLVI